MFFSKTTQRFSKHDIPAVIEDLRLSECFGRSERQFKLFEYLLKNTLEGNHSALTQYSIAIDVLNRSEDFDAGTDSIVRVEMHRLRRNLKAYNAGKFDYSIVIPQASFKVLVKPRKFLRFENLNGRLGSISTTTAIGLVTFCAGYAMPSLSSNMNQYSSEIPCSATKPNIVVNNRGIDSEKQSYVEKIIRSTLSQQTGFQLISNNSQCRGKKAAPIFSIDYMLVEIGSQFNIAFTVRSEQAGTTISSHHVSGSPSELIEGSDLYYRIVQKTNEISMPDSLTARAALAENWESEAYKEAYSCIINMYDSFSGGTEIESSNVHSCLEGSLKNTLVNLDNYGALASGYLELARNGSVPVKHEAFLAAETILADKGSDWLNSAELTVAVIFYEAQRPDFDAERFDSILLRVEAAYSTNPVVLLTTAFFKGYTLGKWEDAKNISEFVKKIYSIRDQSVFGIDTGYALMKSTEPELMYECARYYTKNSIYVNVLLNACAQKAQDTAWLELTEANLSEAGLVQLEDKMRSFEQLKHDHRFLTEIRRILSSNID